jgi:hypothetical protein
MNKPNTELTAEQISEEIVWMDLESVIDGKNPYVRVLELINQAIQTHTAELQRELMQSRDAYFGAKQANMRREAALKTQLSTQRESTIRECIEKLESEHKEKALPIAIEDMELVLEALNSLIEGTK